MIATNIAKESEAPTKPMVPVLFRMPMPLHRKLKVHLAATDRTFQEYALDAVAEKFAAEQRARKSKGARNV